MKKETAFAELRFCWDRCSVENFYVSRNCSAAKVDSRPEEDVVLTSDVVADLGLAWQPRPGSDILLGVVVSSVGVCVRLSAPLRA